MQGGYVSSSHGQQLNVTKKSNVLDKGKPNILNSAAKKLQQHSNNNHDQSNNNTSSNNATDSNDSGTHTSSKYDKQEREPSPIPPPPAVPEVTVSPNNSSKCIELFLLIIHNFLLKNFSKPTLSRFMTRYAN